MNFVKAVGIVGAGGLIGHSVTAATLLITSRIYSPEQFGILATFMASCTLISTVACLRFDYAISIPREDGLAKNYFTFALMFLSATLLFLLIAFVIFALLKLLSVFNAFKELHLVYILLAFLYILFASLANIFQSWNIRCKRFILIAGGRIAQSITTALAQVFFGTAFGYSDGLIVGVVLGVCVASLVQLRGVQTWARRHLLLVLKRRKMLLPQISKNISYILYSTPETLFNTLSSQLPILIIGSISNKEAGYVAMAVMIVQAPLALIGGAVGQVFLSNAAATHSTSQLRELTQSVLKKLSIVGAVPIVLIGVTSFFYFPFFFGAEWERSGHLVAIMCPWFFLQLLASPLSPVLHIVGNFRLALSLQFGGALIRTLFVLIALNFQPHLSSEVYAISGMVFYAVYLYVIHSVLKNR